MKLTENQVFALQNIAEQMCNAQYDAIHPATRHSLFRRGLIEKNWNHRHAFGDTEYLQLTALGREIAAICSECHSEGARFFFDCDNEKEIKRAESEAIKFWNTRHDPQPALTEQEHNKAGVIHPTK